MTNKELWSKMDELLGGEETARRFRVWATGVIKKELAKRSGMGENELFLNQATEILADLNKRTGRRYRLTPEAKKWIKVIMGAGYSVEDFCRVHEVMVKKWADDPKMKDYLQPSTLWQLKKFDERLALWQPKPQRKELDISLRGNDGESASVNTVDGSGRCGRYGQDGGAQKELIAELMAKKWWEFETWAEFMKWTMQFPDPQSLAKYDMPEKLREMRTSRGMVLTVLKNQSPAWAENGYNVMKKSFLTQRESREKQRKAEE